MKDKTRKIIGWSVVGAVILIPALVFAGLWIGAVASGTFSRWISIDTGEYQIVQDASYFEENNSRTPIESASLQIGTEPKEGASVFTYQSSNALGFGFENKTINLSFSQISAKDVVISELIVKPANAPRENAVCYYMSHYELKLNGQTETSMRGYIQYGKTEKGASIKFGIGKENGPQIELSFQKVN